MSELNLTDLDNRINQLIDSKIAALDINTIIANAITTAINNQITPLINNITNNIVDNQFFFGGCKVGGWQNNPTKTTANDTPEFWRTIKSGLYWISPTGTGDGHCLIDQPNDYGWLYHFTGNATEVQQMFIPQPCPSYICIRGANGNGWNGNQTMTWYQIGGVT